MKQKLTIYSVLLLLILGLGGCKEAVEERDKKISEMSAEELPDVTAFQDEFTREFMVSTEPVKGGYYLFRSKTGGYTMMYPENARLDNLYYESPSDDYETVKYGATNEEVGYWYLVRGTYNQGKGADSLEGLKAAVEGHTKYNGEYEQMDYNDKRIHFAKMENVRSTGRSITYRFIGIIQSKNSNQALSYICNVTTDYENDINVPSIEKEVLNIMESVEFQKLE
ncbi:hypothetical protein [Oceanobacillus sp. J11TS1]|uniref:hypothetical protein n=1 Tax=Oceanobacillus sp. J11TS1 TaxID=2807191 RepID=UPI001B2C8BA8|nr:hypothetical protein [Oceanobacillus sp. J11TS1]GIO23944.1 putative lipoprotein YvcA [Oceanobacillus sp. J11TS1]